jgi:hypothetical protein
MPGKAKSRQKSRRTLEGRGTPEALPGKKPASEPRVQRKQRRGHEPRMRGNH